MYDGSELNGDGAYADKSYELEGAPYHHGGCPYVDDAGCLGPYNDDDAPYDDDDAPYDDDDAPYDNDDGGS